MLGLLAVATAQAGTVTVITSFPKELTQAYKTAFEKANPTIKVEILNKNTVQGIAYVRELPVGQRPDIFGASAPDAFEVLSTTKLLDNIAALAKPVYFGPVAMSAPSRQQLGEAIGVIEPQVLLLDETLSNLNKTLHVKMRQELLALQRRLGLTAVFVAHDQEEAMTAADRMAVLDHGVLQQVGTMNLLPARVCTRQGGTLTLDMAGVGEWCVPVPAEVPAEVRAGNAVTLSFRPQALCMAAPGDAQDGGRIGMAGQLEASEFLGQSTRYRVRVGPHTWPLTRRTAQG